jgi:hypothetical protein
MTYEPRLGELRQLLNPKEADVHSDSELRTRNENSPSHVRRAAALPYAGGGQKRRRADDDAKELNSSGTLSENFTHLVVGNFYKLYRSNHRRLFLTY